MYTRYVIPLFYLLIYNQKLILLLKFNQKIRIAWFISLNSLGVQFIGASSYPYHSDHNEQTIKSKLHFNIFFLYFILNVSNEILVNKCEEAL